MTSAGGDGGAGYRRPPKRARFKPGRSGNPKGRPVRSRNVDDVLSAAAADLLSVTLTNGRKSNLSKDEIMARQTLINALKGDLAAIRLVIDLAREVQDAGELAKPVVIRVPAELQGL